MILTKKQEEGLKICVERYKNMETYTCIAGYAGTGKSTLVKFIISALNLNPEDVAYVAYTGKAASVLAQKGCPNATTAHKLLYYSKPMPDGNFLHRSRPRLEQPYKLIIVDEISMLPKDMWYILLEHRIPIICCGDPEQLPPIYEDQNNHILDNPHVFLDEIMRQAQESEIIRLSMHIREGNNLSTFNCDKSQVQILSKSEIVLGMYDWADQMICSTNKTRNELNQQMRTHLEFGAEPQKEDKLICLSNHWGIESTDGKIALTNGAIGNITNHWLDTVYVPQYIKKDPIQILRADLKTEEENIFINLPIDYQFLTTNKPTLTKSQSYRMLKNKMCPDPPFDFSYGYAITCHKAQGSEWNKVFIQEEEFPFDSEEHRRWLYTAITRASEKAVIIKK